MSTRTLRRTVGETLAPLVRVWVRYAPVQWGKPMLFRHFAWVPREFETTTQFGTRFAGTTIDLIQRHLYFYGTWEPRLSHWLDQTLRPGDVFIDVGANIGYFTLLASRRVGVDGRVVAIEASPSTFRQLLANIARNSATNVRVTNAAATDHKGPVTIFLPSQNNIGHASIVLDLGNGTEQVVDGAPLPDLVDPDDWRRARVIKIDVEGAEGMVLRGLLTRAHELRRDAVIVVEITPDWLVEAGDRLDLLLSQLAAAGFQPFVLDQAAPRGSAERLVPAGDIDRQLEVFFVKCDD